MALRNRRLTVVEDMTEGGINAALRRLAAEAREVRAELQSTRRTVLGSGTCDHELTTHSRDHFDGGRGRHLPCTPMRRGGCCVPSGLRSPATGNHRAQANVV